MAHDCPVRAEAGLSMTETDRRKAILGVLKDALRVRGISCSLVGRRSLVLRSAQDPGQYWHPVTQADPQLYVFAAEVPDVVTTDGRDYHLADGRTYPAADPSAAARMLARRITGA
jgi:hypothetical protein